MIRATFFVFAAAAALSACSQSPEQQIVADAASALGGQRRILAVKTLVIEGEGTNGNLGQDMTMDATSQQFAVSGYKRSLDLVNQRARTEQTRTPNFAYFQGPQAQKQVLGIDGDVGYNIAPKRHRDARVERGGEGSARGALPSPAQDRPCGARSRRKLANPGPPATSRSSTSLPRTGSMFTLAIDATTKLPTWVVSMTDNTNLGDVLIETAFDDYQDVSGLKVPRHFTTKTDKYKTAEMRVTKQTIDGDTGDLAAPAGRRVGAGDCRPAAGHGHRRGSGERHLVSRPARVITACWWSSRIT